MFSWIFLSLLKTDKLCFFIFNATLSELLQLLKASHYLLKYVYELLQAIINIKIRIKLFESLITTHFFVIFNKSTWNHPSI